MCAVIEVVNDGIDRVWVGGYEIREVGTADTTQGMATCYHLDHFGRIEALLSETLRESRKVLLGLRSAGSTCRPGVLAVTAKRKDGSAAGVDGHDGANGNNISS